MRPSLTVLTDPLPIGQYFLIEPAKRISRRLRNYVKPYPPYIRSEYRGHFAVTRSLVEGLKKIGVNSSYNPTSIDDLAEVVVVLSGISTLRQAIQLKRKGYIRKILAGPNLMVFPSEHKGLICAPEVDLCVVPSNWVRDMYEDDSPDLISRCVAWPAGVDTKYWHPSSRPLNSSTVLFFEKQNKGPVGPLTDYFPIVKRRGYNVDSIVYGKYLPDQYLRQLQEACVMVGFVTDESQGIAWAEAWSTNVSTLLWFQDHDTYKGRTFSSSTAPYLTDYTGLFFNSPADFERIFEQWEKNRFNFQARKWVLENMSDEVCAKKICELAGVPIS